MAIPSWFKEIIQKGLSEMLTFSDIIKLIDSGKKVAFFPCSKMTRFALREIKKKFKYAPENIIGCFDSSENANTEEGFKVLPFSSITDYDFDYVIVTSSNFPDSQKKILTEANIPSEKILCFSLFDYTLAEPPDKVLDRIERVYGLLCDRKSRATYLINWLYRVFKDETLSFCFEKEEAPGEETIVYKSYKIKGVKDPVARKEFFCELYTIKDVHVESGDFVLDIGAYVGDTAIYFADAVGKNGKVFAFEPSKYNYKVLVRNIEENGLVDLIIPINKAVSDRTGRGKIVSSSGGGPWFFMDTSGNEEVEVVSIDDFVKRERLRRVDFIKIDAEGEEGNILKGAVETLKRFKPKLAIALYHRLDDLYKIPLFLNEIGEYKFYVRQKMEGPFGLTLYCRSS